MLCDLQVRYAGEGNIFASCSKDGAIKIWDAVTNRVINTIPKAHQGSEVSKTRAQFATEREQKSII